MIKRIDPKAVHKLVSLTDPAIDEANSDIEGFRGTADITKLKFLEGKFPTFFLAKNLGAPKKAEINDKYQIFIPGSKDKDGTAIAPHVEFKNQNAMMVEYFTSAVASVEEEGVVTVVTPDEFSGPIVQEIGAYVMMKSSLTDEEKKS